MYLREQSRQDEDQTPATNHEGITRWSRHPICRRLTARYKALATSDRARRTDQMNEPSQPLLPGGIGQDWRRLVKPAVVCAEALLFAENAQRKAHVDRGGTLQMP